MTTSNATKIFAFPDTASLLTVFGGDGWTSGVSTVAFVPSAFTGLVGWFDANSIAGITSGTSLSVWTDISGSGNHLNQPTAARQPIFLRNQQNSLSAVSFGNTGIASAMTTAAFTLNQPCTVALTFSFNTTVGAQADLTDGNTAASAMLLATVEPGQFELFAGSTLNSAVTASIGSWYVGTGIFNGSNSTVAISGTAVSGAGGPGNPGGFCVGSRANLASQMKGLIGEVVVYNRSLTNVERTTIEGYLKTKWATS